MLTIADFAELLGWDAIGVAPSRRSPLWAATDRLSSVLGVSDGPLSLPALRRPTLFLIDDVHRIEMDDLGLGDVLAGPVPVGIFAVGTPDFLSMRTSFMRTLPKLRSGIALAPASPGDGRAFGVTRLPDVVVSEGRAGRGALVIGGEPTGIQLPYADWTS